MSNVVAIEHLTLDGVMQGPGRSDEDRRDGFAYGGWGVERSDPMMQEVIGAHMGSAWSLLVGRITYESLYGFWPKQPANFMTEALNNVEKFVASHHAGYPLPWQNSTLLRGDAADAVATLKQKHEKTLVIFGSGMLVQSLLRRELIDEVILQIHPLTLGRGRRLFPDGGPFATFRLADAVTTGTGVIIATYRPASTR